MINNNYNRASILSVNILYLIVGLLLLLVGFAVQSQRLYLGLLVTEYVLILIPNIIFIKAKGNSLRGVLRINGFSFRQFLYTIAIVIFSYPIAVFLNMIVLNIINTFVDFIPQGVPIPTNPKDFLVSFIIVAVTPGICEEVMFRGTMLNSYEKLGYKKGIIITSLLFGIFHFNITNLVGPAFLGIVLGIIALKSNSIFLPIIGHTLNNAIALVIGYFATKYAGEIDNLDATLDSDILSETVAIIVSTITIGIIALVAGLVLYRLIKKFPATHINAQFNVAPRESRLKYLPVYIVLIIFIVLTWFTLKYV